MALTPDGSNAVLENLLTPKDTELRLARVATLIESGRVHEARAVLASLDSQRAAAPADEARLASAYFAMGDLTQAEAWIRKALASQPASSDYQTRLAATLHRQGRVVEAIAGYREALAIDPRSFDAAMGLGSCELDRRDACAAEAHFRHAIAIDEQRAVAWMYLGVALDRQDRGEEGRIAHEHAVKLEAETGEQVGATLGLAGNLRDDARYAEAQALVDPRRHRGQSAEAHMLYAHMVLVQGRLPEGWRHNEFRWLTEHFLARRPGYARPVWDGQDLRGKTILLRAEQGMGDTLQFARYASLVKALGATVCIAVPRELATVARYLRGVDRVCTLHEEQAVAFDYYAPLLSLPRVFGTDLESIPAEVPYLQVDPERAARWRTAFLSGKLNVGLVFGGNPQNLEDRYRSVPMSALAALGAVEGVQFYSLQKGSREAEAAAPPAGLDLVNLGPKLADFADTAAAISQMDLVISVCTSVAHLTGALGKPLWVMLHRAADWRWLTDRDDSPWYPTARLFRQQRRGDWAEVVDRLGDALRERVNGACPAASPPANSLRLMLPEVAGPRDAPGYRPGVPAVTETRYGIVEYLPDDGAIGASLAWYGEWQQQHLDLLSRLVRPGDTVLEAGAGMGAHTLFIARGIGPHGHLVASERRAAYHRTLRRNLAANRVANVTLLRPSAATVDDLRLERLDWLKIDGAESASRVIAGAAETMWRLRPSAFMAVADEPAFADAVRRLTELGYRCWRHEAPLFNAANFNGRANDLFAGRVSLALIAVAEEFEDPPPLDGCIEVV